MRDSSEDFFNNWEASPPQPNRRRPPPPPPPPGGRPPPPPPNKNYVLHQQPAGQPPAQSSYYGAPPSPQPQYSQPQPPASPHQTNNDGWYQPPSPQQYQPQPQYNHYPQPQYPQQYQQPPMMPSFPQQPPNNNQYATNNNYDLQGSMDSSDNSHRGAPVHTFVPHKDADLEDEAPLLEELGINVEHIVAKTKAVIVPFRRLQKNSALVNDPTLIVQDADLAGPLAFALLLGGELLMSGKIQFGPIYFFGLFGCMSMTLMLNLMSAQPVSFWTITSILGYSLLPVNVLALLKILTLGYFTKVLAVFAVLWSTTASTRLLEIGCNMSQQRYLLAYPLALLYTTFVLITIF